MNVDWFIQDKKEMPGNIPGMFYLVHFFAD